MSNSNIAALPDEKIVPTPLSELVQVRPDAPFWAFFGDPVVSAFIQRAFVQTATTGLTRFGFEVFVRPFGGRVDFGFEQEWSPGTPVCWPFVNSDSPLLEVCEILGRLPEMGMTRRLFWEVDFQANAILAPTAVFVMFNDQACNRKRAILEALIHGYAGTRWEEKFRLSLSKVHQLGAAGLLSVGFAGGRVGHPTGCQLRPRTKRIFQADSVGLSSILHPHIGEWRESFEGLLRLGYPMTLAASLDRAEVPAVGVELYPRIRSRGQQVEYEPIFGALESFGTDPVAAKIAEAWRREPAFSVSGVDAVSTVPVLNHVKVVVSKGTILGVKLYLGLWLRRPNEAEERDAARR